MKNKIIFLLSLLVFISLIALVYASTPAQVVELKIYKGWNLVSLAVIDYGTWSEGLETTCPPQDLIVLYGYDPLEKQYVKIKDVTEATSKMGVLGHVKEFYKDVGTYQNRMARSALNSGWLYSTKSCIITRDITPEAYEGFALGSIPPTANVAFPAGWNFFTVLFDMVNKNLYEIEGDCIIEKVYIWNPEDQIWMNMKDLKFPGILVGNGIVFKTTNDCLLGKVTVPEAPELPG